MSDIATQEDLEALRRDMATKADLKEWRRQLSDEMKTHMGTLYEKFSGDAALLSEQITGMDKRLGRVEKRVDVLIETVGEIKVGLSVVNEKLDRKADRSQIKLLDRRVTELEAK